LSGILLFMLFNFSHVFDIETPSRGFTVSLLEFSYATRNIAIRTSPLVLPFMFPLTLRLSKSRAFLKFSFVPFYGGYFVTSSYSGIRKFSASPLWEAGGGLWLGKDNLQIIPDMSLYIQKKTIFSGKLSVRLHDLFTSFSLYSNGAWGAESLYLLKFGRGFMIFGLRYPGIKDMGLDLPILPLFNMGITF